jgi:YjbE family integral membrane protein
MPDALIGLSLSGALSSLFQVLMIDLVLAGDNAVAVGLAAAGLPAEQRRKVIALGLAAAVAMRIGFALLTTQLLGVIGLLFAGGLLLLWVCWKMWRDLREQAAETAASNLAMAGGGSLAAPDIKPPKSFRAAFLTILVADLSMSLDNVLAVAGAAREHPSVLIAGLLISIVLMGVAANSIANLLHRHRWIGYVGLLIVLYVALHMMWEGHRTMVVDLGHGAAYNELMPGPLDLKPDELARDG